jgi:hypothetical protein
MVAVVERAVLELCAHPLASPCWPGSVTIRSRILRGYPYSIVYLAEPDEIVIVGVAHHRRRPGYWLDRTGP